MDESESEKIVLTVGEAAALLRISRGLAYEMVRQGSLPTIRFGRRILVPRQALEQMLSCPESARVGRPRDDPAAEP